MYNLYVGQRCHTQEQEDFVLPVGFVDEVEGANVSGFLAFVNKSGTPGVPWIRCTLQTSLSELFIRTALKTRISLNDPGNLIRCGI